jgi:hypothetical protein
MEQPMERPRMSKRSNDPFTAVDLSRSLDLTQSWPLFVIVLAFAQMVATVKQRHQQGWGLLLAGNWLLANTMTNWVYIQFSVPVLLAVLGVLTIIRGLRDSGEHLDEDYRATR